MEFIFNIFPNVACNPYGFPHFFSWLLRLCEQRMWIICLPFSSCRILLLDRLDCFDMPPKSVTSLFCRDITTFKRRYSTECIWTSGRPNKSFWNHAARCSKMQWVSQLQSWRFDTGPVYPAQSSSSLRARMEIYAVPLVKHYTGIFHDRTEKQVQHRPTVQARQLQARNPWNSAAFFESIKCCIWKC